MSLLAELFILLVVFIGITILGFSYPSFFNIDFRTWFEWKVSKTIDAEEALARTRRRLIISGVMGTALMIYLILCNVFGWPVFGDK